MIDFSAHTLEIVMAFMAILILYLLYYVLAQDGKYQKNIHSVASVVEELNREIYYLKQKMKKAEEGINAKISHMSDEEIYQEIERSVYDMIKPLSIGLKKIQDRVEDIDSQIDARLATLENGVKQISIPTSVHGNDDEKIISLYKQGVSLETISKELHISKPEVEFVLKINKIK